MDQPTVTRILSRLRAEKKRLEHEAEGLRQTIAALDLALEALRNTENDIPRTKRGRGARQDKAT